MLRVFAVVSTDGQQSPAETTYVWYNVILKTTVRFHGLSSRAEHTYVQQTQAQIKK